MQATLKVKNIEGVVAFYKKALSGLKVELALDSLDVFLHAQDYSHGKWNYLLTVSTATYINGKHLNYEYQRPFPEGKDLMHMSEIRKTIAEAWKVIRANHQTEAIHKD